MEETQSQFLTFLTRVAKQKGRKIPEHVLSVDPGETTGFAIFRKGKLETYGQLEVKKKKINILEVLVINNSSVINYNYVIIEDYKVYPTKLKEHILSGIFPVKVIGALEYIFSLHNIPVVLQMADTAKSFVTDDKLKEWGMWIKGQEHARDAIRHGVYWLLFGRR